MWFVKLQYYFQSLQWRESLEERMGHSLSISSFTWLQVHQLQHPPASWLWSNPMVVRSISSVHCMIPWQESYFKSSPVSYLSWPFCKAHWTRDEPLASWKWWGHGYVGHIWVPYNSAAQFCVAKIYFTRHLIRLINHHLHPQPVPDLAQLPSPNLSGRSISPTSLSLFSLEIHPSVNHFSCTSS